MALIQIPARGIIWTGLPQPIVLLLISPRVKEPQEGYFILSKDGSTLSVQENMRVVPVKEPIRDYFIAENNYFVEYKGILVQK